MEGNKKIYFLSDFHLGAPDPKTSLTREKKIIRFLGEVKAEAAQIFIVGDLFDFWYEYKKVVPKGYVRILGKLAELTDAGIPVHFFVGNHDMWMKDYFQKELPSRASGVPGPLGATGRTMQSSRLALGLKVHRSPRGANCQSCADTKASVMSRWKTRSTP